MSNTPPPGFAPPEPVPVVVPRPAPPVAAYPPPQYAPPQYGPPQYGPPTVWSPPPPPPPRKPMSTGVLIAIVTGAVAVLSGIVVIAVLGAQVLGSAVSSVTTGPPLVEGEAGDPVAREPLECVEQCFTDAIVGGTVSSTKSFRSIGLNSAMERWGYFESSSAAEEYRWTAEDWRDSEIAPDECFFTYYGTPVANRLDEAPKADGADVIEYTRTQTNNNESSMLWQSVRLFASSAGAEAHMQAIDSQSRECTSYSAEGYAITDVAPAAAIDVPDSVAAVGWTEVSPGMRYYVFDVQRGNIVVRSILTTPTSEITEQEFRGFVEDLAVMIDRLEPSPVEPLPAE